MELHRPVLHDAEVGWAYLGASTMVRDVMDPVLHRIPGGTARGVLSASPGRGAAFAAEFGLPRAYATLDEALADPSVDAVYVSTTNDRHAAQVVAAARAGKHVLCEKPVAVEVADAEEMVRTCDAAGVVFAVLHHQPALPQYRLIRDRIAAGSIGRPLALRVRHTIRLPKVFDDSWRTQSVSAGGGVFFDLTTHDADLTRFLLADEVEAVFAYGAAAGLAAEGVADHAMGVMRTRGGILASFHDAYVIDGIPGVEVLGIEGTLSAREHGPYAAVPAMEVVWVRSAKSNLIESLPVEDRTNPFDRSVAAFHAAVRGEGAVVRTGRDGAAALAVIRAAMRSAASGREEKVAGLRF